MLKPHIRFWLALVLVSALLLATACKSDDDQPATPPGDPSVPRPLPSDVAVYPNGTIEDQAFGTDGAFQIRLLTDAKANAILAFYDDRLVPLGWRKISSFNGKQFFVVYKKGERAMHVSVTPTDDPEKTLHTVSLGFR